MNTQNLKRRVTLFMGLGVVLLMLGLLVGNLPHTSFAETPETLIAYGEVVEGHLDSSNTVVYYFDAEQGDMIQVDVLAFNFVPKLELQNAAQVSVLSQNDYPAINKAVAISSAPLAAGRYYLVISGDSKAIGHFALSLGKVEQQFGEGLPIESGQTFSSELLTQRVYTFTGDSENSLILTVRSVTEDYRPLITLLSDEGEILASVTAPRFLTSQFIIEPGDQHYRLVVQKGEFVGQAMVEVSLFGGSLGSTSVFTDGCYVSATLRVNIRNGGSTDHGIIAVLGIGRYLVVTGFNEANNTWYQVQLPNGVLGWVSSEVVTQGGDCNNLSATEYPAVSPILDVTPTATLEMTLTPTPTLESTVEATLESTLEPTLEPTLDPTEEIATPTKTLLPQ